MKKNTAVRLKTFHGTLISPDNVSEKENYWILIGEKGMVIDYTTYNPEKVLVLFDKNLDDFNVENHNPIKNTLYIDQKDLELY